MGLNFIFEEWRIEPPFVPKVWMIHDRSSLLEPIREPLHPMNELAQVLDFYLLSSSDWNNSSAWSDKVHWTHPTLAKGANKGGSRHAPV